MRFVVHGAGAIGGVLGARLFQAGYDVVLIARGSHYEAIRADGLTIESADERTTLRIPVVKQPRDITFAEADVVLLAVKSQNTASALDDLREATPIALPVVCVQNGVANERMALRRFANVQATCVMCPAAHLEPGVVQAQSSPITGILDTGRYPHGIDTMTEEVVEAFRKAGFGAEARADIMRWKYTKLVMNLGNAVEGVCGKTEGADELTHRVRREGVECLRAAGIEFASAEEDRERRGSILNIKPIGGAARSGSSTWQSLQRATGSIETDYLTGEVVLIARELGLAAPANELLQRLANEAATLGRPPGSTPASEVLALL
ncbi:MAG: 2-dehydropantoate 2-reductase [Acidimicrobiaceae bacterium]|jgi:2-dehydropantoate 2-reductase|nr:2-dehydropantoate 2-reductase [Acidimicrobiaceae bacterium]